jgi:serine protease Do
MLKMRLKAKLLAGVFAVALGLQNFTLLHVISTPAMAQAQVLPNVADLAEKLLPAVVEISVQSSSPDGAGGAAPPAPENSPFKDFFDQFLKRKQQEGQGDGKPKLPELPPEPNGQDQTPDNLVNSMGSGFVIDPKGLIVTNNHVIADAVTIQVHLQDGTLLKAELVGHDPKTDLAVIRVKPDKDLPSVAFGDSDKARIGEWVVAIGNPFGLGGSVSLGIVSARNRDISAGPYDDYLQTDAAINKGNSGGPLFTLDGQVVGINTAIFSPTGGSVGIGFSVPSNTAKRVVEQLIKYGETRRGWLGVKLQALTPDIAEGMGQTKPHGALIADVTAGGPGEKGGLKAGDIIMAVDGLAVDDSKALRLVVAETEVGKEIAITVLRDQKEQIVKVVLGRLEEGEKLVASQDAEKAKPASATAFALGMKMSDISDELRAKFKISEKVKGAVVIELDKDSTAADKGILVGDVIQEAGGKPVATASDVSAAVELATKDGKSSVLVLVSKAGDGADTRFVALKLKK